MLKNSAVLFGVVFDDLERYPTLKGTLFRQDLENPCFSGGDRPHDF